MNCSAINVNIGDSTIVEYYADMYSFTGIDTLATFAEISYMGLIDTIYINVIDTMNLKSEITVGFDTNYMFNDDFFFQVYPNPTKGIFTLKLNDHEIEEANVTITNLLGENILFQKFRTYEMQLNICSQPAGIYLIHLVVPNKICQTLKLYNLP